MKGITWTDERIEALKVLYERGLSASQIAAEMKVGITRNAVIGKLNRLGLTRTYHKRPKSDAPRRRTKQYANPYMPRLPPGPKLFPLDTSPLRCVEIVPRGVTLIELESGDCRWPYGDAVLTFCGHPQQKNSSYCTPHYTLAFKPSAPRNALTTAQQIEKRRQYMVAYRKAKRLEAVA